MPAHMEYHYPAIQCMRVIIRRHRHLRYLVVYTASVYTVDPWTERRVRMRSMNMPRFRRISALRAVEAVLRFQVEMVVGLGKAKVDVVWAVGRVMRWKEGGE
jgi:hypothetical protein